MFKNKYLAHALGGYEGYKYLNMPYVFMENQNWFVKGGNFIKRKIRGDK